MVFSNRVDFVPSEESWLREMPFYPGTPRRPRPSGVDELQRAFWSSVVSLTWIEQPSRGKLVKDYTSEVLSTGKERLWNEWKKPSKQFFVKGCAVACLYNAKIVGSRLYRTFALKRRVDPTRALEWAPAPREKLVWAPVDLEVEGKTEEEIWGCRLSELLDYEPLEFSPPVYYDDLDCPTVG